MSDNDPFSGGNDPGTDDNDPFVGGGPSVGGDPSVGGNDPGTDDNDPFVGGGPSVGGDPSVGGNDPGTDDNDPFVGGGPSVGGNDPSVGGNGPSVGGNDPAVGGGNDPGTDDTAFPVADPNEPVVVDLGDGQSLGLSMDDGSDTVNVALALDLSAFDVFADGNPFSSAPLPEDDLALFGPDPSTAPQDGYTLETRAESTSVLTLGNAVRRGELDTVQIGNAGIADIVAGTETATISGKLREHNGRDMNYIASRVETTVGGRMSVTCGFEDGIMLGGAMTDTWAGATMIGAVMSDDLCAGAGVRATAPVDLWLNMLTGMEERPGTAAADGVFVEACGTLFEREYGPSVYAVGTAMWTGTTYVTMKTGFRPLMRVAMGVRNLLPGAGAAAEEPPPPAPPAGPPAAAGGVVAVAGMVTGMAHMSRATANVGLSADNLADAARAGEAAADMASAHNAADLRHSADTAAQIEDLRTGIDVRPTAELPPQQVGDVDGAYLPPPYVEDPHAVASLGDPYASPYVSGDPWISPMSSQELSGAALPPGFQTDDALNSIDASIQSKIKKVDSARAKQADQVQSMITDKLGTLDNVGSPQGDAAVDMGPLPTGSGDKTPVTDTDPFNVKWPGEAADDPEVRRVQLAAEVDALMVLKTAMASNEDPRPLLQNLLESATEMYGAADPRTQAYADALQYYGELETVGGLTGHLGELDFLVVARTELDAGRDPRVALRKLMDEMDPSSPAYAAANKVMSNFEGTAWNKFAGKVPDGLDTTELGDSWRAQADELRNVVAKIDTSTPEGAERADALRQASSKLTTASLKMKRGEDPRVFLAEAEQLLSARQFLDGGDGAAEASILRAAIAEYTAMVDEFASGLDAMPPPGGLDWMSPPPSLLDAAELDAPPAYSGLPEDFDWWSRFDIDTPGSQDARVQDAPVDVAPQPAADWFDRLDQGWIPPTERPTRGWKDRLRTLMRKVFASLRGLADPDIDDSRHLVAIEPEQALGGGEDAAGAAGRGAETGSGAADSARGAEAGSPGGLPDPDVDDARHLADGGPEQVSGAGGGAAAAQPQLDEGGARWDVGSGSRSPDADTGEHRAEGNYADVSHRSDAADGAAGDAADGVAGGTAGDGAAGGTSTAQATPPDTQAVVDAMPDTSVTGDAGGAAAESDWRHWLAQADETAGSGALDWSQMNDQLFQQYMQYRRDSNWRALIAYGDVFDQMRAELVKALIEVGGYSDEAANAIPTGRAAYAALAEIVDQAGNAGDWAAVQRVGGFLDAFDLRTQDTLTDLASRADELEGVKNHQALWVRPGSVHDLDMGVDRPKLADHFISRQEDAARRMQEASAAGDADAAARLNNEMTYYQQMSVTLERGRNPLVESSEQIAYLRSVGEHAQADEYMELHGQLMETLRNPDFHRDVGAHGYASSSVMRPDLSGHPQPLHTDSYVPGTIDDIDMRSFLRAEVDESGGAAAHGDAAVQANAGDYDAGRDMVNQQVGGADCVRAPQEEPVWVEGPGLTSILKKSDPTGKPSNITSSKGGVEDLMEQRVEIAHGTVGAVRGGTPEMATRVAAANDFWGATAKVDQRAFGQWKGRPQGMRSWKSPTQRAAKGVRFGADHARVLTYTDDVVGLGDTSRTMRYVQAPGGWMPTRQPGFGRTASAAGDFPFSVREQVLNSLMQGKHIDAESSTALHREFFLARGERYATAASKSDWLKMDMLLRNLEMTHLPTVAQGPAFARSFDGKTLGKLLDLFESSASVA